MAFGDDLKVEMDAANLYREEMITDRKMGVIHVLTPVTAQGEKDTAHLNAKGHVRHGPRLHFHR